VKASRGRLSIGFRGMALGAVIVAILLAPVVFTSSYSRGLLVNFGIDALLALGLILIVGYAGQFSLAQAGFAAIGAYGSAIGTVRLGWPPLLAMVVSAGLAALVVYAMGRPILRLRGHFLAMATLAFNEILFLLLTNSSELGGSSGFGGIPPFSLFGYEFADLDQQMYLILTLVAVGLWIGLRIRSSREGRALRALKINEVVAAAHGVNPGSAKTKAFVLSAVFASVAGSVYAHTMLYVNPSPFNVMTSIEILVIIVVGGTISPWGALVGAAALTAIREGSTSVIPELFGEGAVGAGEEFVVGVLLVLVLVLMPGGIVGGYRRLHARVAAWRRGSAGNATAKQSAESVSEPTPRKEGERPGDRTVVSAGPPDGSPQKVRLEVTGLTKRFGGVTAVDNVDLVLHDAEILGVIGPNGAGKTTMINLLSGVLPPTSGRIVIDGRDVTRTPAYHIARMGLARTFQTPVMFEGMTVLETVLVGTYTVGHTGILRSALPTPGALREERRMREIAEQALERCGLSHLRDEEATNLSLGHQKVLEIARGLASRPSILLLDEPAAGLNRAEKQELSQLLRSFRSEGIALILVEHDMEMVMGLVDRVHVLEFGKTLRVGSPAEVRADPEVIRAYLGVDDQTEEVVNVGH